MRSTCKSFLLLWDSRASKIRARVKIATRANLTPGGRRETTWFLVKERKPGNEGERARESHFSFVSALLWYSDFWFIDPLLIQHIPAGYSFRPLVACLHRSSLNRAVFFPSSFRRRPEVSMKGETGVGSITSRCSGNEPTRTERKAEIEPKTVATDICLGIFS